MDFFGTNHCTYFYFNNTTISIKRWFNNCNISALLVSVLRLQKMFKSEIVIRETIGLHFQKHINSFSDKFFNENIKQVTSTPSSTEIH